ncbi:catalase family protein [Sphingomonas sp.]|uniref:catalase family protein n=1 Tax=Sphingomonas sp. TaxID=28214 RepID=UPI0035BBE41A
MTSPVRYAPSVETVEPDEAETVRDLEASFKEILDTTSKDYGHAVRSVHAKAHGIAKGTLSVKGGLPPELAQGLFATPGEHEAILRISTNPGDILDDSIALPRGLALKVLGVDGARVAGSEGDTTQDFIMVNGPVFNAPDPKAFAKNLKLLAKTTDKGESGKKLLSGILRGVEATLEAVGLESATLQQLGGAPQVHPLGETYYSQTAFRYGDHIAKFALVPVSPALTQLTGDTVNVTADRPDALREVVREVMIEQGGTWELRVQLNTDLDAMPVEDPTEEWDEKASPYVTVATLVAPPQLSWTPGETEGLDDALAYSVWNALDAHRPLGGVNRVRKDTYTFSQDYRGRFNGCPLHQPKTLDELA